MPVDISYRQVSSIPAHRGYFQFLRGTPYHFTVTLRNFASNQQYTITKQMLLWFDLFIKKSQTLTRLALETYGIRPAGSCRP